MTLSAPSPSAPSGRAFRPLHFASHTDALGAVSLPVANHLVRRGLLHDDVGHVTLDSDDPTARLEDIRAELLHCGWIDPPRGEAMPVTPGPNGAELARLDRSALRILGFWAQKVHINGLVDPDHPAGPQVWVSRRSSLAPSNPGRWDTLVAGGRAAGCTLAEAAAQEGWEEAGIGPAHLSGLRHVGDMAVQYVSPRGFHQELLVIHELFLPPDFVAVCHDGEIEKSIRLSPQELMKKLAEPEEFKFSSYLVLMDLIERIQAGPTPVQQVV